MWNLKCIYINNEIKYSKAVFTSYVLLHVSNGWGDRNIVIYNVEPCNLQLVPSYVQLLDCNNLTTKLLICKYHISY